MRTQALTLEQWRRRYCLSRRELAKKAEIAHSTIWRIEKARHLPIDATRRQIAQALGGLDQSVIAWPTCRAESEAL